VDERWADEFGANAAQMRFVQTAVPGETREAPRRYHGERRAIGICVLHAERTVIGRVSSRVDHQRATRSGLSRVVA
jgi:hypothetical protein